MTNADKVIHDHSRSFSLATRLLPRAIAPDVRKLYAWCRSCDNAVDEAENAQIARTKIAALKDDVHRIYANVEPQLMESIWLKEVAERYDFPIQWPLDLLDGMESDIEFRPLQNVADLERYCYLAAGVVGLMMSRILGAQNPAAMEHAKHLGMAMQMTNIARDVAEDWERGRVYLPGDWLPSAAISANDVAELVAGKSCSKPSDNAMREPVERLLLLAERYYRSGKRGLAYLPFNMRWSIRVAADVYSEIGEVIRQHDHCVMQRRHFVPSGRKLSLVWRSCWRELFGRSNIRFGKFGSQPSLEVWNMKMKKETLFLALFGLSLTCVMATAMFALVGLNPKLESYSQLPWLYSLGSALAAIGLGWFSRKISRQLDAVS